MSDLASFFDPFAPGRLPIAIDQPEASLPKNGRNFVGPSKGALLGSPPSNSRLPITGQGTIAVSSKAQSLLLFTIKTEDPEKPNLYLEIGVGECTLFYTYGKLHDPLVQKTILETQTLKNENSHYLNPGVKTTYWLSIDNSNGVLSYGKYYTNKSMTLFEVTLKEKDKAGVMVWKDPTKYGWLDFLKVVSISQDSGEGDPPRINLLPLPVVIQMSPFIDSGRVVSLLDLEIGTYTIPTNLPQACQVLYGNVAGPNIMLDTRVFPDFSKAIQYSVITPGKIGFNILKAKSSEFGHDDFKSTYLRITLGYNLGDSPGIPYVLEIWPSGHYSPVHDHGNANAVIKVLHGEIQATFFDSLTAPGKPNVIGQADLKKDMITWIGPENYQVHQLKNISDDVCCTIQCYRYDDQDDVHYDGFNYVEDVENPPVKKFIPNSDMAYSEFVKEIQKEWDARPPALW